VWQLSKEQWQVIDAGIAFYKKIAPVIKKGYTSRFGPEIKSYRHPMGWQGILRVGENGQAFALFHAFHGAEGKRLSIPVPKGYAISDIYSYEEEQIWIEDGALWLSMTEDDKAVAVYLEKNS
jgi:alpha-galactosidase